MLSDFVHERLKGWFARILLGLIIVSFALFGIDAYFQSTGGGQWAAKVEGQTIAALEFDEALKREQARLRELGERDPARLESPELRRQVLDGLIRGQVLVRAAIERGYDLPEEMLFARIAAEPAFQENGRFSQERFQTFLTQRRLSRGQFLQIMRQESLVDHMLGVAVASVIVPKTTGEQLARALAEQREVSRALISAENFLAEARVDDEAIAAHYAAHPELSRVPERIRVAYVVFSPEALLSSVDPGEAELRAYYDSHRNEFAEPESREAAHILIRVPSGASGSEREAAAKRAAEILERAKAAPHTFAALAREFSQDPSTARRGGDLGTIVPGSVFPELEKALAAMKPGEVSGPVQSPAGLHVLLLKSVQPARVRPFEEVRDRVAEAARRDAALRRFNEEAEKFGDLVYAQPGSLEPAAAQYGLRVQVSDWLAREGRLPFPFDNERLLSMLFSSEAIQERRNTEAVEVAPNTLAAARVLEHQPASQRPLAEVREQIARILAREKALKLAREHGQRLLERLRKGEAVPELAFDAPRTVERRGGAGLSPDALRTVFATPATSLPAYAGHATPEGFAVYRISRVTVPAERLAEARQLAPAVLLRAQSSLVSQAYAESVRQRARVEVNEKVLQKAER